MDKRKLRRRISVADFCMLQQLSYEARGWLISHASMSDAWLKASPEQRLSLAVMPGVLTREELTAFALFCLSQRRDYMSDQPAWRLFAMQKRYADGKVTRKQLSEATGVSMRFRRNRSEYRTELAYRRALNVETALDCVSQVLEEDRWDRDQLHRIWKIANWTQMGVFPASSRQTDAGATTREVKDSLTRGVQHVWLLENTKPNFGYFQHYMLEQERQLQLLLHSVTELNWQAQRVINVMECLQGETV